MEAGTFDQHKQIAEHWYMFTNANTHTMKLLLRGFCSDANGSKTHRIRSFGLLTSVSLQQLLYTTKSRQKHTYFSPFANAGADWFFALAALSASLAASMSFWLRKLGWLVEDSSLAHILSVILTLFLVDVTLCGQNKFSHIDCKSNITRDREEFCLSHMEATLFLPEHISQLSLEANIQKKF